MARSAATIKTYYYGSTKYAYILSPAVPLFITKYVLPELKTYDKVRYFEVLDIYGSILLRNRNPNIIINYVLRQQSPTPEDW